ncbi:UNVERIFIED_CONTAM: hypothetical protein GTU68_038878 [Idotea baltica]|nr:hypothetical protein [Idotea baltica]
MYANCPGLKVVTPCTSYDAKGLLKSSIRDNDPVVFIESEAMYGVKGPVPEEEYIIPLEAEGVSAEVIDLRTIRPLDEETLFNSVKKTNRALVVSEAWPVASVGSWLAAHVTEKLFDYLDAPVKTISGLDYPYPYSKTLEASMRPTAEVVARSVMNL